MWKKNCGHLLLYNLKTDIFCIPERKEKAQKKAQWLSFVQAFSYQDINLSSSNFIFLPKLEIKYR